MRQAIEENIGLEAINGFHTNLHDARKYLLETARIMNALCCREESDVDEELQTLFLKLMNEKLLDAARQCVYYFKLAYEKRKQFSPYSPENSQDDDYFEAFDFFPDWAPVAKSSVSLKGE